MRSLLLVTLVSVLSLPLVAEADIYEVTASRLNVRKSANASSRILGVAKRGDKLMGAKRTDNSRWIKVSHDGVTGYVYGRYIKDDDPDTFGAEQRDKAPLLEVIAKSGLNMRSGPGSTNRRVGAALPLGTLVSVLDTKGNWSRVRAQGKTGWVYNRFLGERFDSKDGGSRSTNSTSLPASFRGAGNSPSAGNALSSGSSSDSAGPSSSSSQSVSSIGKAPWIAIAKGEIGISESTAAGRKRIREFHKKGVGVTYGHKTPWCASFMNWVMKKSGLRGTGSAMARSFERYGERLKKPKPGCLVVFWRVSKSSGKGHVAIFLGESGNTVRVLGGNQRDAVNVRNYPKSRILGYRWPR